MSARARTSRASRSVPASFSATGTGHGVLRVVLARRGAVPKGLLAALPPLPPGYRYVELAGEVVMVASTSKMVVDGISRSAR